MAYSIGARLGCVVLLALGGIGNADDGARQLVGPFAKDAYPQRVIDRPLTLPAGMVEGEVGAQFFSTKFDRAFFGVTATDAWDGFFALRVGVTDRIQIEAGTSFSLDYVQRFTNFQGGEPSDFRLSPVSWRRVVPFRLSFLALDTQALDTAVTLTLPFTSPASRTFDFGRGGTLTIANTEGRRVLPAVALEAPTRWRLTDWLWLRAGQDLFTVTTGSGVARMAFDLGVGVQPHRLFAATFDMRLAQVAFDGDGSRGSETIADASAVTLSGFLTPCRWFDLVGALDLTDAGDGFDTYAIRTAARVRF